jgi:hypothetical protein
MLNWIEEFWTASAESTINSLSLTDIGLILLGLYLVYLVVIITWIKRGDRDEPARGAGQGRLPRSATR